MLRLETLACAALLLRRRAPVVAPAASLIPVVVMAYAGPSARGAAGFLLKATPADKLIAGIETVATGEALLANGVTRRLIEEHISGPPPATGVPAAVASLTDREREVLVHMARGRSNDQIAAELLLSTATVKTHVNRVLAKLQLRTRVQAVGLAYETGLVRAGSGATS